MSNQDSRTYFAPGRVNIIGEHTDYNQGFVLPTTTAAYTYIRATPRRDRMISIHSANLGDSALIDIDDRTPRAPAAWSDYARGVAVELEESGKRIAGADLQVDGDIPIGGGLSSSASFEVALAVTLLDLSRVSLSAPEIAAACRRAEQNFTHVQCGIMDQMVIADCPKGHAYFLDCRSLQSKTLAIPESAALLVVDSGVRHEHPDSGYNDRHTECAQAVRVLRSLDPEITSLRDASLEQLAAAEHALGPKLSRRARHIVTENDRVVAAYEAMQRGDLERLGELISQSHTSQRDDFEISCDSVDRLVDIADSVDGTLGARQVGGGFGGCVLVLTTRDKVNTVRKQVCSRYRNEDGLEPWSHIVSATAPAGQLTDKVIGRI